MVIYDWLMLAAVLAISGVGAYTDIRAGVVKNRHLLVIVTGVFFVALVRLMSDFPSAMALGRWAINLLCALGASVVFYRSDLWAPGDAKLYLCISALYPCALYATQAGNVFPSLNFVVSSFAAGYLYLVYQSIRRGGRISKSNSFGGFGLKQGMDYLYNMGLAVGLQAVLLALWPAFFEENRIFCLLLIVGLSMLAKRKFPHIRAIAGLIGFLYYLFEIIFWKAWLLFGVMLLYAVLMAIAVELLDSLTKSAVYRTVEAEEIKPQMILSFGSVVAMQNCIDSDLPRATTESRRSRMTQPQAEAVKRWASRTSSKISIVEMLPFAPFIALSVLIELARYAFFYMGR